MSNANTWKKIYYDTTEENEKIKFMLNNFPAHDIILK